MAEREKLIKFEDVKKLYGYCIKSAANTLCVYKKVLFEFVVELHQTGVKFCEASCFDPEYLKSDAMSQMIQELHPNNSQTMKDFQSMMDIFFKIQHNTQFLVQFKINVTIDKDTTNESSTGATIGVKWINNQTFYRKVFFEAIKSLAMTQNDEDTDDDSDDDHNNDDSGGGKKKQFRLPDFNDVMSYFLYFHRFIFCIFFLRICVQIFFSSTIIYIIIHSNTG